MVATIGVVPIALDLAPRHSNHFSVFTPAREPLALSESDLGGIAIPHAATGSAWLVGHHPGGVKLLVNRRILRRVVVALGRRIRARNDEQSRPVKKSAHERHGDPPGGRDVHT